MDKRYNFFFDAENVKKKPDLLFAGLDVIDSIISPNFIDEVILDDDKEIEFDVLGVKEIKIANRKEVLNKELRDEKLLLFCNESKHGLTSLAATITKTYFSIPSLEITNCNFLFNLTRI